MSKLLFAIFLAGFWASFSLPINDKVDPRIHFYAIDSTWDGIIIPESERVNFSLQAVPDSRDIIFRVDAPFHNDPPPDSEAGQPFLRLWNYEVAEIFFLNDQNQYLEVEISPHGQHLVLLYNGPSNTIRHSLPLQLDTRVNGSRWTGKATIPGDYFPPQVIKMNAYALHGPENKRRYLALYPSDGTTTEPDMHNLSFFQPFNITKVNPKHQNFDELSQLWKDSIQGIFKYKITRQWNNFRSKIPPTTASLQGFQGGVEINFTMPLNDENYPAESFVVIFENGRKEAVKIQLFVDGNSFVEFFSNRKIKISEQNYPLDYRVENRASRFVKGSVMVPPSFFPPNVNLVNMYALFGVETMLAMTLRAMEIRPGIDFRPNLNNIEHFISIDFDLLVASDNEYSNLWRTLLKIPLPTLEEFLNKEIGNEPSKFEEDSKIEIEKPREEEKKKQKEEKIERDEESDIIDKKERKNNADKNQNLTKHETEESKEKINSISKEPTQVLEDTSPLPTTISSGSKDNEPTTTISSGSKDNELTTTISSGSKVNEPTTTATITEPTTQVHDAAKTSKSDAIFQFTESLLDVPKVYNNDDQSETLHKDQPHFNKPLRFLLKKPQTQSVDDKEEDFNPLRIIQKKDSSSKGKGISEIIEHNPLKEKKKESGVELQKPLKKELQEPLKEEVQKSLKEELQEPLKKEVQEPLKEEVQNPLKEELQEPLKKEVQEPLKEELQESLKTEMLESSKTKLQEPLKEVLQEPSKTEVQKSLNKELQESIEETNQAEIPFKEDITQGEIPFEESLKETTMKSQIEEIVQQEIKEQEPTTMKTKEEQTTEQMLVEENTTIQMEQFTEEISSFTEKKEVQEPTTEKEEPGSSAITTEEVNADLGAFDTEEVNADLGAFDTEEVNADLGAFDTEEEAETTIEREKHQRRYEEASNKNELPITFKITFEPKDLPESAKQEIVELENFPETPDDEYPFLDEILPDISDIGGLPPPHPVCFTEGLVPDYFRCQVFYECVLNNGAWEVYNWRCKRGTYYDPVKVACIKGYC